MPRFYLFLLLFLMSASIWSQTTDVTHGLSPISSIDMIAMPSVDHDVHIAQVRHQSKVGDRGPKKFATDINTSIAPDVRGTWESIDGDRMVWRLRVRSEGAFSLNFGFDDFYLPPSAMMYLYTSEGEHIIGPLTMEDNDPHRQWWSPIIPTDDVVVDIRLDHDEVSHLRAHIAKVNHDFSGVGALLSGSCNVDVACGIAEGYPLIEAYRDVIRGVGMYSIGGTDICTGTLINTTRNDCTPYVLTALHCEVTPANAASVVIYWNYENSICRTPNGAASGRRGDGQRGQFNSGAQYIAGYSPTDVNLLLLDDPVPAEYDPYFAGWDRMDTEHGSGVTIHHPNSEEKRFSADLDSLESYVDGVFYRVANWEIGTTEGGSSGAALFDTDKQVIGQLNGGLAACGNNDFDDFGMLAVSWDGGGTPETRLRDWLDPDDSGAEQVLGRACVNVVSLSVDAVEFCATDGGATFDIGVRSGYADGATVRIVDLPEGIMAQLSSQQLTSSQPIQVTVSAPDLSESYVGSMRIEISDAFTTESYQLPLRADVDAPRVPTLLSPADGTENIDFEIDLNWESTGRSYDLQISREEDFSEIDFDIKNIAASNYTIKGLDAQTPYYWRIRSRSSCGISDYSVESSFETGTVVCTKYTATDLPKAITSDPIVVTSEIRVTDKSSIAKVRVLDVQGKHSWISDLEFRLKGPDGSIVDLLINGCDDHDDYDISFDDDSDNINLQCPINNGVTYRPRRSLSIFDDKSAAGTWALEVKDDVLLDEGSLDSWTLELCIISEMEAKSITLSTSEIVICEKKWEAVPIDIILTGDWSGSTEAQLINGDSGELISTMQIGDVANAQISFKDISSFRSGGDRLIVRVSDGETTVDRDIIVDYKSENLTTELSAPTDTEIGVDLIPMLSWQSEDGISYTVMLYGPSSDVIWDTVTTASSVTLPFELQELTEYTWSVTTKGDCSPDFVTERFSFTTTRRTATTDTTIDGLEVYPNPTADHLKIDYEHRWSDEAQMVLYDLSGRIMISQPLISTRSQKIILDDLAQGIYIYRIIDRDLVAVDRVMVVR